MYYSILTKLINKKGKIDVKSEINKILAGVEKWEELYNNDDIDGINQLIRTIQPAIEDIQNVF